LANGDQGVVLQQLALRGLQETGVINSSRLSVYGVRAINDSKLALERVSTSAENALAGARGPTGSTGSRGSDGSVGHTAPGCPTSGSGGSGGFGAVFGGTGGPSVGIFISGTSQVKPKGTVTINSGRTTTKVRGVTLKLSASDPSPASGVSQMRFRNANTTTWPAWWTYTTSKSWTLSAGAGTKTVYVQYRDRAGNVSAVASDSITHQP
jgi:hypothetical protein